MTESELKKADETKFVSLKIVQLSSLNEESDWLAIPSGGL